MFIIRFFVYIYSNVWCWIPWTVRSKGTDCTWHKDTKPILFGQFDYIVNAFNVNPVVDFKVKSM